MRLRIGQGEAAEESGGARAASLRPWAASGGAHMRENVNQEDPGRAPGPRPVARLGAHQPDRGIPLARHLETKARCSETGGFVAKRLPSPRPSRPNPNPQAVEPATNTAAGPQVQTNPGGRPSRRTAAAELSGLRRTSALDRHGHPDPGRTAGPASPRPGVSGRKKSGHRVFCLPPTSAGTAGIGPWSAATCMPAPAAPTAAVRPRRRRSPLDSGP